MKHPRRPPDLRQRRAAYAAFEATILTLYEQRALTLERLDHIATQYRWLPVGSSAGPARLTQDGKDLSHVCLELVDPAFPLPPPGSRDDHEASWEHELRTWEDLLRWRWHWHAYGVAGPTRLPTPHAA